MKSLKLHHSRRWWIVVIASGVLLLSVLGYGIYSLSSWQAYERRTVSWQQSTKQTLTSALSLPAASGKERSRKLAALKDAAHQIRQAQSSVCTPARLTGWQLMFSGAKADRELCGAYSQKVDGITKQLDIVTAYLEDEAKVMAVMQPALSLPQAVSEKDWDQTATVWSTVHTALSTTSSSKAFAPTKEQVTTVSLGIDTSWKELIAAHTKKDKSSFVAAVAQLQKSYEATTGITTVNSNQLSVLSAQLQSLIDKL